MNESKAVHVTKQDLNENFGKIHEIYLNKVIKDRNFFKHTTYNKNVSCQFDSNRSNSICTCRNLSTYRRKDMTYFSGLAGQIYTYRAARSYTEIGIGKVKALQKKKVKRIYLPETKDRGVGSEDYFAHFSRRNRKSDDGSYYKNKRTSSKCVGGIVDYRTGSVISEKLSPIIRTRCGTTSPSTQFVPVRNIETGSNTIEKNMTTTATQVDNELLKKPVNDTDRLGNFLSVFDSEEKNTKVRKENTEVDLIKGIDYTEKKYKYADRTISSDSLIQHVHNLENPSQDKNSQLSLDHMENRVERVYRNIFSSNEKDNKSSQQEPKQDLKSASILRKRFEALRRGFAKKEDLKKKVIEVDKLSSQIGRYSRKDVSVVSDPPSLEGRLYSITKTYSPFQVNIRPEGTIYKQNIENNKTYSDKQRKSKQLSQSNQDSEYQDVEGMFRLWGKKFNLEEDYYKKKRTPKPSLEINRPEKIPKQIKNTPNEKTKHQKQSKKFFFFKKKIKDKPNEKVRPKKSITAGRCELSQGLIIKIGGDSSPLQENNRVDTSDGILQKYWLSKYLTQEIESRNSVQIRWNNNTYNTSSSTVFDLMNSIYEETGVVSRSEVTIGESSYFRPNTQRVNFACKEIDTWMIPKIHQVKQKQLPLKIQSKSKDNIKVTISNQKWFIDRSKAFSNKIQVVLHSNNLIKISKDSSSSEYLRIDIPKGFFIDSSSSDNDNNNQSSDEEVYKIVEYETEFDSKKRKKNFEIGDHKMTDIEVTVSVNDDKYYESNKKETVIKEPPTHRDVAIQGSTVNVPNRCNVIEVGIITQRDLRETRKPISKSPVFLTDEESNIEVHHIMKKCEFAESFLQDYYRNWTPLGPDLSSWCISDSNVKCSDNSESSFYYQGDGCKSCPNIYDDFQASAVMSSNDPCGSCVPCPFLITSDGEKSEKTFTSKLFKKIKSKTNTEPHACCKRVLPKDSLEVFKRRKIYAASNKAKWACPSYGDVKPYSVPSIEDKEAQDTMIDCPKVKNYRPSIAKSKRTCKKHVSMPDCETMNKTLTHQLTNDLPEGILTFKGTGGCEKCKSLKQKCSKHAIVDKASVCKIVDPLCKDSCLKDKKAPCSRASSKSNNSFTCSSRPKSPIKPCQPPSPDKTLIDFKPLACKPSPISCPPLPCDPPPTSSPDKTPPTSKLPACIPSPIFCPPPPCSPPPISKPPPSCTPTSPFRSTKLLPLSKKCSPICPAPKKLISHTPCKKCQPKPNSYSQSGSPPRNPFSPIRSPCCKKLSLRNRPSYCRPCTKTQSSQTSPKYFEQSSNSRLSRKEYSCQSSPKRKKRPTGIQSRCDSNKKENSSTSDSSICNTPPCRKLSPVKNKTDEKFQWPLKNQVSNQSSLESVACRPAQQLSKTKDISRCKKNCPPTPNSSNQSLIQKKKVKKEKECKPDCANIAKMQERISCLPPLICPPVKNCPPLPPKSTSSKPNMSGIYLKMKPSMKRTCSEDCLVWQDKKDDSAIKLNCNDNITIKLRKQTPSTEEIREGVNIKVKDIDGQTLYERRDYIKDHSNRAGFILGDMYKSSNINRVSGPIIIKNIQTSNIKNQKLIIETKSEKSIANLIEIQFKVKVAQGDKTTEINTNNNEDNEIKKLMNKNNVKQPEDIFMLKNTEEHFNQDAASNNDVNIRILIKNYKPNFKIKKKGYSDDFSKKISEKFNTVSTVYSDVCPGQNADNVYSIHRATIDLTSSVEKSKAQCRPSDECVNLKISDREHNITISNSTKLKKLQNKIALESSVKESVSINTTSRINSPDFRMNTQNQDFKPNSKIENTISDVNASDITSNEIITKPKSKKEKKELLKMVFEKANGTTTKNKSRMKRLRDMLKMILTSDSSGPEDLTITSNELAKDITYASLKPNYFRDSDSMNNYYRVDSEFSLEKHSNQKYHPTEQRNSECSVNSEVTHEIEDLGCICSILAEKLNLCKAGEGSCCCRDTVKRNEDTCCDVTDEDDCLLINFNMSEVVDVETQNSLNMGNESNSNSIQVKRRIESNTIKTCPAILSRFEDKTNEVFNEGEDKVFSTDKYHKELKKKKTATLQISNRDETIIVKTKPTTLSADMSETEMKNRDRGSIKNNREIIRNETVLTNLIPQTDILQSYETKKAVLEMYTESAMSGNCEHLVAKLPKFVHPTEKGIKNYEKIITNYKSVCQKNIVMSIQRF